MHWLECSPFVVPRQAPARLPSPATPQGSPFIQHSVRLLCTCHAPGNVLDLGERAQWREQTETLGLPLWVLSSTKVLIHVPRDYGNWLDLGHQTMPRISGEVSLCNSIDGAEVVGGRFFGGKWTSCCQRGEEWMPPSEQKQVAEPPGGRCLLTGPQLLRGSDSQRSGSLPSLFQPSGSLTCSFLPLDAAPDEDERAGRLPEHHGALAPQRLLAAHHAAAQRGAALPPAR